MTISYNKLWIKLKDNNLTKEELAKTLKLRKRTIIELENNQKVCHTVLNKLANYFKCNVEDLMDKQSNKSSN